MNKHLLLSTAVALSVALSTQAEVKVNGIAYDSYDQASWGTQAAADHASWMKYLPDDVFVAHLSIPGTHDSCTDMGWVTSSQVTGNNQSTTQACRIDSRFDSDGNWSVGQMEGGIRAFDLRPGLYKGELQCCHGVTYIDLTMKECISLMTDYLDNHPSEFFIIHLFRGNVYSKSGDASIGVKMLGGKDDDESRQTMNTKMNEVMGGTNAKYFIDFRPDLKVGECRGKIIVLRRDRLDYVNLPYAGNMDNWTIEFDSSNPVKVYNASNYAYNGLIHVQDISDPSTNEAKAQKQADCLNLVDFSIAQEKPNDAAKKGIYKPFWVINFTSAEDKVKVTSGGTNAYKANAETMNPLFFNHVEAKPDKGPLGIIFSDYVLRGDTKEVSGDNRYLVQGDKLVDVIIDNNFKYMNDYILDTTIDQFNPDKSQTVDMFEGKEYFIRNVATGEFMTAGGTWGTLLCLDKVGIRIKPVMDASSGAYRFMTTFRNNNVDNGIYIGLNEDDTEQNEFYVDGGSQTEFNVHYTGKGTQFTITRFNDNSKALSFTSVDASIYPYDNISAIVKQVTANTEDVNQVWEFVTVEERIAEDMKRANPSNPVNMSYMIRGRKFDPFDGDNNGYNNNGWVWGTPDAGNYWGTYYSADRACEGTNDWNDKDLVFRAHNQSMNGHSKHSHWTLTQTVTGLPEGKYKISAQMGYNNYGISDGNYTFTINGVDVKGKLNSIGTNDCVTAKTNFRNDSKYTVVLENQQIDNGNLTFDFQKMQDTKSETSFFCDNFELWYYGSKNLESIEYTPQDEYDTLILPFDAEVPDGMYVYHASTYSRKITNDIKTEEEIKADGGYEYYVIQLEQSDEIMANRPYVVSCEAASIAAKVRAKAAATAPTYTFWGIKNPSTETTEGILRGNHEATTVASNQFAIERWDDGSIMFKRKDGAEGKALNNENLLANRAVLVDTNSNLPSNIDHVRFEVLDSHVTTGVENVTAEAELTGDTLVNVYTIGGVQVRSQVPFAVALNDLAKGIYIVASPVKTLKVAL